MLSGKVSCCIDWTFNWIFKTGFPICKERPDVNNFTKILAHILNYEFYHLYYIVKIILVKESMLGYISTITNYTEELLDQPIFIKRYTKLVFCSNNPFFIVTHPKISQTNLPYYRALKVSTIRSDLNDLLKETRSF